MFSLITLELGKVLLLMNLNLGDIYAILTAFCWSFAVILFDISSKKLNSLQMSFIKNFIGVLGFIV